MELTTQPLPTECVRCGDKVPEDDVDGWQIGFSIEQMEPPPLVVAYCPACVIRSEMMPPADADERWQAFLVRLRGRRILPGQLLEIPAGLLDRDLRGPLERLVESLCCYCIVTHCEEITVHERQSYESRKVRKYLQTKARRVARLRARPDPPTATGTGSVAGGGLPRG